MNTPGHGDVGTHLVGVVLAGGRGSRMGPLGQLLPKPLLPICNRPLIVHQIELMRALGIREIFVLLGYRGEEIQALLGDGRRYGVRIRYAKQGEPLGIAHAVGCLEPLIDRPFLLFLGDIFLVPNELQLMWDVFCRQGGGAVLTTKEEDDPVAIRRNFAVHLSERGRVTRVVEKPRDVTNRLKGVGVYLFDVTIFDAIRRTHRSALRNEHEITDSIQIMIDDGRPVGVANAIADDMNLTTPADLLGINLRQARLVAQENLIGERCRIHEKATIRRSVVGDGVTVAHPIEIVDSVIFDNVRIDRAEAVCNAIVTADCVIDCAAAGK